VSGGVTVTWKAQVVGKMTCKKFSEAIATRLLLPNPLHYTGHCWRRTAATLAANAGLSMAQLKCLTGHRSDTVLQVSRMHIMLTLYTNLTFLFSVTSTGAP
jgi:integrase